MTVPEFPNFFMLYGPGTNLASGGEPDLPLRVRGALHHGLPGPADRRRQPSVEPRRDRYDDWYERCQAELRTTVWAQPSIKHSFYKNADGVVHSLSPWRLVDFWSWTRTPEPGDFVFS